MSHKSKMNFAVIVMFLSMAAALLLTFGLLPSVGDIKRPKPKKEIKGNKYMGAGSCASSNCHGAAEPRKRAGIDINQNEFSIWNIYDKHRKAFDLLLEPKSQRIARNLRLSDPAEESEECLVCHSTYVPAALWGKQFDLADGVSCESCHGPSEKWLGPHTASDWSYEKSLELGMYDTKNIFTRAKICVDCHIGDEKRSVDHEMIAAGHPDINKFELDTFVAFMPPHWRKSYETDAWADTEIWGAGQIVALKQAIEQLARRADSKAWHEWPEFSEFDCYSCHHNLRDDSWRQVRGYAETPGIPPWNASRYVVLRQLANKVSPELRISLDREISTLSGLLDKLGAGGSEEISSSAMSVVGLVDSLESDTKGLKFDESITYELLLGISDDGEYIANAGVRSAEQAAMALESLFFNYNKNVQGSNNQQISDAISGLFDYLEQPENYQPSKFNIRMRNVNRLLKNNR